MFIILSGTSIGANDFIKYTTGQAPLRSRSEYCQFIEKNNYSQKESFDSHQTLAENENLHSENDLIAFSKIWNLKKTLAAYRAKRIVFTWLPRPVLKGIAQKQINLFNELKEVQKNIQAVSLKLNKFTPKSVLERKPSSYVLWQKENEWPLQLKILGERSRLLENKMKNLKERRFTDSELLELIQRAEAPISESLVIEVRLENGLFTSKVSFYPTWKRKGHFFPASDTPWFQVSKRFLPKQSLLAFQKRILPNNLKSYLTVASRASNGPPSLQLPNIEFINENNMILSGTPKTGFLTEDQNITFTSPNDLAIEGLLDLACLYE